MEIENLPYLTGVREIVNPPAEPEWDLDTPLKESKAQPEEQIPEEEELGPEDHIGNFLGIEDSLREQAKVSGAIHAISNYLIKDLGCRTSETLLKGFVTLMNRFGVDSKDPLNSLFALERRISKNKVIDDRFEQIKRQQANNFASFKDF